MRRELAQGTAGRKSEVNGVLEDARQTIGNFRSHHEEMGTELRKELSGSRSASESEVKGLLEKTKNMMKNLRASRREAGNRLREGLAQGRAAQGSAVKDLRSDFRKGRAGVKADLGEAAVVWQGLANPSAKRRGEAKTTSKVEPLLAEELIPDPEVKLLTAINEHPDGITLTEVADSFGIAPIVLGRASRSLLERGEIRKEDKLYFPRAS